MYVLSKRFFLYKKFGLSKTIFFIYHYFYFLFKINSLIKSVKRKYLKTKKYGLDKYKYLDTSKWIFEDLLKVYILDLQNKSKSKRILDIGCGTGYFLFICKYFGHEVVGIDLKDDFYKEFTNLLNLEILHVKILPKTNLGIARSYNFDLVTAFMICFDKSSSNMVWDREEWEFFINDIEENILAANGAIALAFNRDVNTKRRAEIERFIQSRSERTILNY